MSGSNVEDEVAADLLALAELLGAKRYEATQLEFTVWERIVRHPGLKPGQFRAFLTHHLMSSPFAPQPHDAMVALGLRLSADQAFRQLVSLVREWGPYTAPENVDPALIAAIQALGGWEKVNKLMPDPDIQDNSYQIKQFRDEFDSAFTHAQSAVHVQGVIPEPLRAIGHSDEPSRVLIQGAQSQRISQ